MLAISDEEFTQIRDILYKNSGVLLRPTKKPLVVARLRKRLEELNYNSIKKYVSLLDDPRGAEMEFFINALTTNETFFFRHTVQFNFLYEKALPELAPKARGKFQIWSGASSTGEEPYSLAIALTEYFKSYGNKDFMIWASDINTRVIEEAKQGEYEERSLREVPSSFREKYFSAMMGGKHKDIPMFKVNDEIKRKVSFFQHNLKTPPEKEDMDIIFLRNVLIYFDKETKQKVVNLLERSLKPGGYFFISLSENLNDISTPLKLVNSCIFKKPG